MSWQLNCYLICKLMYLSLQVLLYWYSTDVDIINNAVILFLYYLIGTLALFYS
jgi:hypothetical protein